MEERIDSLAARGEIYKFLSLAYGQPEQVLQVEDFITVARQALNTIEKDIFSRELKELETFFNDNNNSVNLAIEYTRLFRGPVKADVYTYESMYVDGEIMGKSTMDVLQRYAEAGVQVSREFKDLPDHICAEMEFMGFLCAQELAAWQQNNQDEAKRFQLIGDSFVIDHLSKWVSRFSDLILEHANTPYYLNLARITRGFIAREASTICAQTIA